MTVVTGAGEIIRYREQAEGEGRGPAAINLSSSNNPSISNMAVVKLDPSANPLLKSPKQADATLPLTAITSGPSG